MSISQPKKQCAVYAEQTLSHDMGGKCAVVQLAQRSRAKRALIRNMSENRPQRF